MRSSNHVSVQARLPTLVGPLSIDEPSLVVLLAEQLAAARRTYGFLRVDQDGRNVPPEALEEAVDLATYAGMALLAVERGCG